MTMTDQAAFPARPGQMMLLLASPTFLIFVSSNFVNVGNLAYNMIFSRLIGPELFGDLAAVLTVKLAVLGVLNALQLAVSQRVAASSPGADPAGLERILARLNVLSFWGLAVALQLVLFAIFAGDLSARIGLSSPWLLAIVMISLPVTAPLAILRGVVLGRLHVSAVILSSNLEMLIRLIGGLLAWEAGAGIVGVAATIPLSIVAAWMVLRRELPVAPDFGVASRRAGRALLLAALPFAVLQMSQVVLLDGDVLTAKTLLGATDAGYSAALALFQRIQFFGCFGIAAVLLPSVAAAVASGESALRSALPVAIAFVLVSVPFMAGISLCPELLLRVLVGPAFVDAAPILWIAGTCAAAFTLSYLLATFLAGLGDRAGIWLIVAAMPVQVFMIVRASHDPAFALQTLLDIKLWVQLSLAALVSARCVWTLVRRARAAA
ncbi:MAG: hypothetical protein ACK5JR_03720 [Tropicimonas sp.]|uniref:hypothetical protein n=1 Tax=Tropicimonas sp. TaxID=2067044 RepID=UPI003A8946D1